MTRYTFVLLVCRVIGILSLVTILDAIGQFYWIILSAFSSHSSLPNGGSLEGLAPLPFCLGMGLPLAGACGGLFAERIAIRFKGGHEIGPTLTPLAIGAVLGWSAIDERCYELIRIGLTRWSQTRILGAGNLEKGNFARMLGIYPGDAAWLTAQLGVGVIALCLLLAAARRAGTRAAIQ